MADSTVSRSRVSLLGVRWGKLQKQAPFLFSEHPAHSETREQGHSNPGPAWRETNGHDWARRQAGQLGTLKGEDSEHPGVPFLLPVSQVMFLVLNGSSQTIPSPISRKESSSFLRPRGPKPCSSRKHRPAPHLQAQDPASRRSHCSSSLAPSCQGCTEWSRRHESSLRCFIIIQKHPHITERKSEVAQRAKLTKETVVPDLMLGA